MTDDLTPPHWNGDDIDTVIERMQSHNDVPVSAIVDAITALRAQVAEVTAERDAAIARESAAYARGVHDAAAITIRTLASAPPAPQCCMCGKKGLSTVEDDGGTECGLDDGRWVCSAGCYDRAYPDAPPVVGVGVKPLVREELENIEKQLHVNEGYFDGSQRTTLEILQGHIKDSVSRIRAALEGDA